MRQYAVAVIIAFDGDQCVVVLMREDGDAGGQFVRRKMSMSSAHCTPLDCSIT